LSQDFPSGNIGRRRDGLVEPDESPFKIAPGSPGFQISGAGQRDVGQHGGLGLSPIHGHKEFDVPEIGCRAVVPDGILPNNKRRFQPTAGQEFPHFPMRMNPGKFSRRDPACQKTWIRPHKFQTSFVGRDAGQNQVGLNADGTKDNHEIGQDLYISRRQIMGSIGTMENNDFFGVLDLFGCCKQFFLLDAGPV